MAFRDSENRLARRIYCAAEPLERGISKGPWLPEGRARSELDDRAAFERDVLSLRALYGKSGSDLIRGWIEHDLAMLGESAGLDGARIAELARLPDPPEDGA